jgi:hypothetical protein
MQVQGERLTEQILEPQKGLQKVVTITGEEPYAHLVGKVGILTHTERVGALLHSAEYEVEIQEYPVVIVGHGMTRHDHHGRSGHITTCIDELDPTAMYQVELDFTHEKVRTMHTRNCTMHIHKVHPLLRHTTQC